MDKNARVLCIFHCRLPSFTPEQKKLLKGTADFLALNFYSVSFAEHRDLSEDKNVTWGYFTDQEMKTSRDPTWLKGWNMSCNNFKTNYNVSS